MTLRIWASQSCEIWSMQTWDDYKSVFVRRAKKCGSLRCKAFRTRLTITPSRCLDTFARHTFNNRQTGLYVGVDIIHRTQGDVIHLIFSHSQLDRLLLNPLTLIRRSICFISLQYLSEKHALVSRYSITEILRASTTRLLHSAYL